MLGVVTLWFGGVVPLRLFPLLLAVVRDVGAMNSKATNFFSEERVRGGGIMNVKVTKRRPL